MQHRDVMRAFLIAVVLVISSCHSAQMRGPGPGYSSAVGYPSNRETAMPPGANHPANYGYGSAYDPHPTGGKAQRGTPGETGATPWVIGFPAGRPIGVPPPVADPRASDR